MVEKDNNKQNLLENNEQTTSALSADFENHNKNRRSNNGRKPADRKNDRVVSANNEKAEVATVSEKDETAVNSKNNRRSTKNNRNAVKNTNKKIDKTEQKQNNSDRKDVNDVSVKPEADNAVRKKKTTKKPSSEKTSAAKTESSKVKTADKNKTDSKTDNKDDKNKGNNGAQPRRFRPRNVKSLALTKAEDANAIRTPYSNPIVADVGKKQDTNGKIAIIPLGGLGEVGKNMTAIKYGNNIIIIDCGMSFPDEELLGIDLVIPDISYLLENKSMVRAIFITHGHEDHIGSLPYVLKELNVPVYAGKMACGLIENKLKEHFIKNAKLTQVEPGTVIDCKPFKVEFIRVSHSIPDSYALAIHTPLGVILHTGDFKMDLSPVDDQPTDISRLAQLGAKGVLALIADSTNVEVDGFTKSEKTVGPTLDGLFAAAEGRIILTTFASNVHRIQQCIWAAEKCGRKVAFVGRGMINVSGIARELGYLKAKKGTIVDIDELNNVPESKSVVITTGSQGEDLSGLTLMSLDDHHVVNLRSSDTVIVSASTIPGNEKRIVKVIDNLYRHNVKVIYGRNWGIHVSGHASSGELTMMQNLIKPKYFIPAHGEYRMLYLHGELAKKAGVSDKNVFIMENGQVLEMDRRKAAITGKVASGRVLIDGRGIGDIGTAVLKDRKQLSSDGIVIVIMTVDKYTKTMLSSPEISTRGFVFEKSNEDILAETKDRVLQTWDKFSDLTYDANAIKGNLRNNLGRLLFDKTGRRPIILPIIIEV